MTRKQWMIIGMLGAAVAVCFICGACLVLSMVISSSRQSSPEVAEIESTATPRPAATSVSRPTNTPQPSATPTLQAIYKINESVAVGNWEYKVTKTEKTKTLVWSQYGNKTDAKGIFLIVYMTLKNIGTRNFSINTWDFELHDDAGIKYDTSSDFGVYSFVDYKKLTGLGEQFPPGLPLNTALVFDINPSAKGLTLYLEQAKVSIDLGQ